MSLLSSCSSPWPLGTSLSSGSLAFVCLCKHILILHQRVSVCVLEIAKYCFPLCVCLAFMRLLVFVLFCSVLATVHVVNVLESNMVYSLQVFFCVVVLFTSCKREEREGGGGAQRLPGEEEVVSNEVTPWQPNDSSHSVPPPPHLSTWPPLSVPTHSNPPPPDRESCPWC